jgi:cyclic-di-AMP phosphodiesterase PgpH
MKKVFQNLAQRIPNFARYLMALTALLALSALFPTNATLRYRFNMGQTWLYDDLTANFDFAILKTTDELAKEKADMAREFSPFYEINLDIIKERKKQFAENFDIQLRRSKSQFPDVARNTEGYITYGNRVLDKLLGKGILKQDTFLQKHDKDFIINILRGNTTEKHTVQNLLTPEKARSWLTDSLPFSPLSEPEFLLPLLEPFMTPNVAFNAEKTKEFKQQELDKVTTARGMVKSGELIVPKGGIVTQGVYQKLLSYREQYESDYLSSRKFYVILAGYYLLTTLILSLFMFYLKYHAAPIFEKLRWILFLLGWIVLYTYLMYAIKSSDVLHPYMVPFCIAPIVIKNFYRRELAFITHVVTVLTVGLITSPGYEFIFLQLMTGLVVTFTRFDTRYWANFFQSIFYIVLVYVLGYLGFLFIEESNLQNMNWSVFTWLLLNGFLTLLAYPLIPLLGNLFGFISNITLAELSDLSHPLMKELSLKAPGTLQHSLQVANLAEAAAKEIGAKDLLVKVGALYHDVGKTLKPQYFIENQSGTNPHDQLTYLESARTIIEHVTEGVKMAEKNALPQLIIDFIRTHHGTTAVEYFYRLHAQNTEGGQNDRKEFQYAGPRPRTREEVILMLADSLEATSKSLKSPTNESIDELVERIVADKVAHGQLQDSDMTFNELEKCKASFKATLKSIHHVRIEYPLIVNR